MPGHRVLIVDDDPATREFLSKMLAPHGYVATAVRTWDAARRALEEATPDLILLDIRLPDADGRAACRQLRSAPATAQVPIVLMTAFPESGRLGLGAGADAVLHKPIRREELLSWVGCLVRARQAAALEERVEQALIALAATVEARAEHRHDHPRSVARYSERLAEALGLPEREIAVIRTAALLHDIGMIGVPEAILQQPRSLAPAELAQVKPHTLLGAELVRALPQGEAIAAIVRSHHERWHGGGYPDGLAGAQIPLGARIVAVADAYDALTAARPYRAALSAAEALDVLWLGAGAQWDPDLVERFAAIIRPDDRAGPRGPRTAVTHPIDPRDALVRYLTLTGDRP
jgi:putative two-component system response regulator